MSKKHIWHYLCRTWHKTEIKTCSFVQCFVSFTHGKIVSILFIVIRSARKLVFSKVLSYYFIVQYYSDFVEVRGYMKWQCNMRFWSDPQLSRPARVHSRSSAMHHFASWRNKNNNNAYASHFITCYLFDNAHAKHENREWNSRKIIQVQ